MTWSCIRGRFVTAVGTVILTLGTVGCESPDPRPSVAMFHGSAARGGWSGDTEAANLQRIRWSVQTGGAVRGSPVVADGAVYFGSTDGMLRAVDSSMGTIRWEYDAGAPLAAAPVVTGDHVVIMDRENTIHGVHLDGRRAWVRPTGTDMPQPWGLEGWDYIGSAPVVAGGTVFVGSGDGHLYAIDPEDGAVRWSAETGGRVRSAPAVADGTVYVGSGDGHVYAFDVASGEPIWVHPLDGAALDAVEWGFDRRTVQAGPTLGDGLVFVGSRDAAMYALAMASGTVRWQQRDSADSTSWVIGGPALTPDGTLIFGRSSSSSVHALNARTGAEIWRREVGSRVFGSPVVGAATAFVGDGGGWLSALDLESGDIRWQLRVGGAIYSSPALEGDRLFVGSDDGNLYALDLGSGPSPIRAVYRDTSRLDHAQFGRLPEERAVTEYLTERGYELLDRAGLTAFLRDRVRDRVPSVVVFGIDDLPPGLDEGQERAALLTAYLEADGKVVWIGYPPTSLVRDPETAEITAFDRSRPESLLGVPFDSINFDEYGFQPTAVGRDWGLTDFGVAAQGLPVNDRVTVLATDELGHAVVWVRRYGGPPATGFVQIPETLAIEDPEVVAKLADAGLLRRLPLPPAARAP